MPYPYQQIEITQRGRVHCVRLKRQRLTEDDQIRFGDEMAQLIADDNCRRVALGLGNDKLDCLYSMFLGKLVMVRRLLLEAGGHMHLCEVGPASLGILETCRLTDLFVIHPDMDAAATALEAVN